MKVFKKRFSPNSKESRIIHSAYENDITHRSKARIAAYILTFVFILGAASISMGGDTQSGSKKRNTGDAVSQLGVTKKTSETHGTHADGTSTSENETQDSNGESSDSSTTAGSSGSDSGSSSSDSTQSSTDTTTGTTSVTTTTAPYVDPNAMPTGNLPGWTHIFSDDFTTNAPLGSFDSVYAAKWSSYGRWPDTAAQHYTKYSGYFTDKVVSVNNGVLDKYLHSEYSSLGTTATGAGTYMMSAALTPRIHGPGTSGISGQLYGRYSVRLKSDAVSGYKIAWLLWPDSGVWPRDGEIDFAETNLTGVLKAFIHKQNGASGSDQTAFTTPGVYLNSGWHIVTLEWAPTLRIYVDGVLEGETTDRIPNTPMHLVLQTESEITSTTNTASGHLQLDWVSIWSKN